MSTALVCSICYELTWRVNDYITGDWRNPRKWWTCKNCMEDQQ